MRSRYKHILLSNDTGERLELEQAPQGWDSQKFNIIRDLTYLGVLKNISVEYEFVGDGFRFLQKQRLKFGMDADIMLRVYRNNPNEFLFEGKINYENFVEARKFNKFRVDIVQSSAVQKFQNREDVEVNILNNISLDRLPVTPAEFKMATIRGRRIEFVTQYRGVPPSETPGDPEILHHLVPLLIEVNGNPGIAAPFDYFSPETVMGLTEFRAIIYENKNNAFYVNTLPTAQPLSISGTLSVSINLLGLIPPVFDNEVDGHYFYASQHIQFCIRMMNEEGEIVETLYDGVYDNMFGTYEIVLDISVSVPTGHYLIFACERNIRFTVKDGAGNIESDNDFYPGHTEAVQGVSAIALDEGMRANVIYNDINIRISQDSVVNDSEHPVILPFELFSNLLKQINGGVFTSTFFGREDIGYDVDGEGAYLAITTGELLRGIPPTQTVIENGVEKVKKVQIATSMREAFKSYSSVFCLGAILTDTGMRIEPLSELFNNRIAADLGEVSDLEIRPSKEFIFNSVKAGYPINEYEEQNGRDEFNTTYQYTNSFKSIKKELDLVSKYHGDGYGIEFARRLSILTTGTQDTRYDDKIFFIDLVKVTDADAENILDAELDLDLGASIPGTLRSRRLEGVLNVSGIFGAETAMNLKIAVGQNMLRWAPYLNIPLHKKDKVYYFQTKDKNTSLELVTELGETIDGQDLQMGGQYFFINEERNFNSPLTLENLAGIIANPLGLLKFTYEGEQFFDLIMEAGVETDKGGKTGWRALGTRDTPVEIEAGVVYGDFIKYGDGLTDFLKYGNGLNDYVKYGDN